MIESCFDKDLFDYTPYLEVEKFLKEKGVQFGIHPDLESMSCTMTVPSNPTEEMKVAIKLLDDMFDYVIEYK